MRDASSREAEPVTERVVAAFASLPELSAADADLVRRGRFLSCEIEIGVGAVPLAVTVVEGRVTAVRRGPFLLKPWDFAVRAEPDVWQAFLTPLPRAGFHDILALTKSGRARVEGNLVPFMGNLQVVKDILALPRGRAGAKATP